MKKIWSNALLVVVSTALAIGIAEVGLRLTGFRFRLSPERVEFGWPDPVTLRDRYRSDPLLLWVPPDYNQRLEELRAAPPDIVFLGDSCTEFGDYPERLRRGLARRPETATVTVAKLGVGGWSTAQGLEQLRHHVVPLRPRVVSLYFGWNDHWIGFGVEDARVMSLWDPGSPWLEPLRFVQLLTKARLAVASWGGERRPYRVPPAHFRENLRQMVELTRAAGAAPLLLSAPSSHIRGDEPEYLQERWIESLDLLVPLHDRYVDIVRELAAKERVPLCDLDARFRELPPEEVKSAYFRRDGIHLTRRGNGLVADYLLECFDDLPQLREALAGVGEDRDGPGA